MNVDLNAYSKFVDAITSNPSKIQDHLDDVMAVHASNFNVPRLLTAGIGLSSETGEFNEILKKVMFQGKPFNPETHFHLMRELGDIMWYWVQACIALGLDPNQVIAENVNKLQSRYPGGEFNVYHSENLKTGDL